MKRLFLIVLLVAFGWQAYAKYQAQQLAHENTQVADSIPTDQLPDVMPPSRTYTCDGRTYCSQMTSCEEATFFLRNCPDVKMDGNHDGVPCEQQWCQ
jgi:hypothetical protein